MFFGVHFPLAVVRGPDFKPVRVLDFWWSNSATRKRWETILGDSKDRLERLLVDPASCTSMARVPD